MGKQKIVLKLPLDDERKRRKAFKAAVGVNGVTSATMEGDKIIVVGEGVDPIALTTMLRRGLGYVELLSVSSGDDKKKGDGYGYGGYGGGGGGMAYGGSKAEGKDKDHGHSGYGGGGGKDKDHGHGGYGGGMAYGGSGGKDKDHGHGGYGGGHHAVAPTASSYPAYYNPYSAVPPSYPVYSYYPTAAYPAAQEQDPGCSIM